MRTKNSLTLPKVDHKQRLRHSIKIDKARLVQTEARLAAEALLHGDKARACDHWDRAADLASRLKAEVEDES